jgi:riboflavin synthase
VVILIFTGIIEEVGNVRRIERGSKSCHISVSCAVVVDDVKLGDSIAVNGVCLTVVEFSSQHFSADVMPETFNRTTLKNLHSGSPVNLERALRLGDRMGGHMVQGHIDGIGTVVEKQELDIAIIYRVQAPAEIIKYVVGKGSIAIDGISLTVVETFPDSFTVSLIPHTAMITILGRKRPGEMVNLETDIIGRYVARLLVQDQQVKRENNLNLKVLAENGFL